MSNFLRNLFGDKHKAAEAKEVGNIPKAPPSSSSSPSLSTTTAPIVIPTIADDESMTEEIDGVKLKVLWKAYLQAAENSEFNELESIFSNITSLFLKFYSNRNVNEDNHEFIRNMAGHPPKLVLRYFTRFCELLNDISAAKGHHNMDPSKLLRREYINTACFYPGDELDNSKDQPENQHINDIDIFHAKRTELLQCLEIVSILVAWPQNVAVIRNTAGKKFIMYFMACAKAFREKLDFLIHQTFSEVQTLQDLLLVREENLLFTMEVHLHLLHFLAHSTSTPSSEFYDFLPCQPWTSEEIYHLTQESMMHMTIASNGEGFEKTFLSSSVQKNVVLEAVKRDLLVEIVEQGHFSHLVNLWKSLQVFKTIPKHGITGNELAIMERKTDLYTVIMEAEVLDVMSNVYASAPELIPSRLSLDFPIRQVFEASVQDLISSTCTVDALITRIKLLCLRINSSIMAVNHQGNLKVMDGSLTPKDISKVLIWFHEKFHKYETDMDWIEKCLTSCSDFVTIQFGSVVGTIDKSHDLWPWHHDIGSGLDDENTTVATDFHLLPKTTLTKLSTEVKKQPAYVLWDALVCEVMGTQSLSNIRPPISGKAKVGKSRIHYTFQIFHEVFRHKMYQEATVPSSSMRAPLPFGQLKFVDFISQIFRAAEASEIFQILEEFETFRLLLSDKFLCSFGIQISMVAETYTQASIEYIEGKQVVLKLLGVKNDLLASLPVWLLLQNGIVDYFHGLAIYSMYFQSTSVQDVVSYLGYEDILLVLTQQVMALCRGNKYPHVVYQMTRLIINLNDIAQSMGVASRKDSRNKIISYVLEVVEISCRTRATVAPENKIDIENCMLFAGLSAATELLLHLISPATSIGFDWLEVFLQDDQFRTIDLSFEFQKTGVHRRRNVASTSSTLSSSSSSKITSRLTMAVDKSPMDNRNDDTKDRGCRLRNSIASLLTLLLDENLYRAAVYITQCLIVACAEETVAIDKEQLHFSQGSHHDSGRKRKQAIRSLAADAMNQLLAFAAVSHKHSNLRFSILVVNDAMNSIIFLLRDARYQHLRLAIQEFIRRENILYEILRSFARCLNGFDIMKTKLEGVALEEMDKFTADIIRTTLTLITATVSGNDACKNILSLLLQANREKVGSSRLKSSVTSMDGKSKNVSSKTASGLTSLILCGEKSPSHDTIVVILDLILDGPFGGSSFQNNGANAKAVLFSHDEDRPKIKNFAILPDFFLLIPHCQEQVQWFAIESFKNLVCGRASLVNLNVCSTSRPKVIDIALDLFPYLPDRIQSSNSELVELLGRHSVSVASLKHLFRVLQQKDGLRVPYSWKIIQSLQGMFLHENSPKHTFVFDGTNSGLKLPTIYKWPVMKGFSFCCWIKVESPKHRPFHFHSDVSKDFHEQVSDVEELYNPYVLCLRDKQGCGVELHLKRTSQNEVFRAKLRSFAENGETTTFLADDDTFNVLEDKWHFLAFSLAPNSFYNKGEAIMVLDGRVKKQEFGFVKLPDTIHEPLIGECLEDFRLHMHHHTLRGQMGAMYFFNEYITDTQMQSIYALGPDYVYNFEPFSADYKELTSSSLSAKANSSKLSILEDGILTNKILMTFNPVVLRGKYFLDNTPERNDVRWRVPGHIELNEDIKADAPKMCKMHAMRLSGTYRVSTQDARLALNSLGGIKAIIPLFAQIDQSIPDDLEAHSWEDSQEPNFFPAVLGLFTTLLEDSPENRRSFVKCGGFATIRNLIERADSSNFNLITFNQFVALYLKLEKDLTLQDSILENILCNFRLWAYSPPEVQIYLFDWLIMTFKSRSVIFPNALGVQRLLDMFYLFYDYQNPELSTTQIPSAVDAKSLPSIQNPRLSQVPNRLSNVDVASMEIIREKIFNLMKISLNQGLLPDDVAAMIKYLVTSKSDKSKREMLVFLLTVLEDIDLQERFPVILLGFMWGSSIPLLEHQLLTNPRDTTLLVVQLFSVVLHHMRVHWTNLAALYIQFASESNQGVASDNAGTSSDRTQNKFSNGLESASVKSPSNLMFESGLTRQVAKFWNACINMLQSQCREGSDAQSPYMSYSLFINLLQDILLGNYPEEFVHYVCSELQLTKLQLTVNNTSPRRSTIKSKAEDSFAYPFLFFTILNAVSGISADHIDCKEVLEVLYDMMTPYKIEQLIAVEYWQDYVALTLNYFFTMKEDNSALISRKLATSCGHVCVNIFCMLVDLSIRLGKMKDHDFMLHSLVTDISLELQDEIYSKVAKHERGLGMVMIRDSLLALDVIVEDAAVKAYLYCTVLLASVTTLKDLILKSTVKRKFHTADFIYVHRRNIWLLGLMYLELLDIIAGFEFQANSTLDIYLDKLLQTEWYEIFPAFQASMHNPPMMVKTLAMLVTVYLGFFISIPDRLREMVSFGEQFLFVSNILLMKDGDLHERKVVPFLEQDDNCSIGSIPYVGLRILYKFLSFASIQRLHIVPLTSFFELTLKLLLQFQAVNVELFAFERLYLLSFLTHFLSNEKKIKEFSSWNPVGKTILDLISQSRQHISMLMNCTADIRVKRDSLSADDDRIGAVAHVLDRTVSSAQYRNFVSRYHQTEGGKILCGVNLLELDSFDMNADLLFAGIDLGISTEELPSLWQETCLFVVDFADFLEEEFIPIRMMEFSLGEFVSSKDRAYFSGRAASLSSITTDKVKLRLTHEALVNAVKDYETLRLQEYWKLTYSNNRRSELKWSRIFAQLANERGPWGYGAESKREVFWTLDPLETDRHMRIRLRRNPFGTRHMIAALKANGIDNADEQAAVLSTTEDRSLTGIYADLKKYKKIINIEATNRNLTSEGSNFETASPEDAARLSDGEADDMHDAANDSLLSESDFVYFSVEVITPASNPSGGKTLGKLEISKHKVSFSRNKENEDFDFMNKTGNAEFMWACECFPTTTWPTNEITGVYRRYYQLRYVALEIFFTSRTAVFINFDSKPAAAKAYSFLLTRTKSPNMDNLYMGKPSSAIHKVFFSPGVTLTQAWVMRKITNFDYLMYLNFIAGRTFNDLAQYPVFPWVIAEYTANKIDLKDPKIYRQFDKPMAAQAEFQRAILAEKYESCEQMQDDGIFPYHTGSHYSTSAMVIWYLIRMEPFTSYHVWLQDGKFDRPDRLFHSIEHTYTGCTTNTQDVKELIPEFYHNPEFLYNLNQCDLGKRQNGAQIDDVTLPKWARDANEYVRINREALESEYVTEHLHLWIDLIFGSKQRPPFIPGGSYKAVDALNVFVHLSYVDAVDLEGMKETDPALYYRTIRQIDCYGQTPAQLFTRDHPKRKSLDEIQDLIWPIASCVTGADTIYKTSGKKGEEISLEKPTKVLCYGEFKVSNAPIIFLAECVSLEKLITIDTSRILGYHIFVPRQPDNVPPFTMKPDKMALSQSNGQLHRHAGMHLSSILPIHGSQREKTVGIPFAAAAVLSGSIFDRASDLDMELIGSKENKLRYWEEELRMRGRPIDTSKSRTTPVRNSSKQNLQDYAEQGNGNNMNKDLSLSNVAMIKGSNSDQTTPMKDSDTDSVTSDSTSGGSQYGKRTNTSPLPGRGNTNANANPTNTKSSGYRRDRSTDEHLSSQLFSVIASSKYIVSAGHWDNTFKITAADTGKLMQSLSYHREVVTCVSTASDYGKHWIVVGSKDCTLTVWEIFPDRDSEPVNASPTHTLYGHDDAVNCVATQNELDLVVSGSDDGTIIIHTLREGLYIRSITFGIILSVASTAHAKASLSEESSTLGTLSTPATPPSNSVLNTSVGMANAPNTFSLQQTDGKVARRVHSVVVSDEGNIVGYSNDGFVLASYTLNGRFLRMTHVRERIYCMCLSMDGKVLLTGGERGLVVLRFVHTMTIANTGPRRNLDSIIDGSSEADYEAFPSPIRSMTLTKDERHLIVGLESGEIRILAQDSEYLRRKLHRRLMEIGILSM